MTTAWEELMVEQEQEARILGSSSGLPQFDDNGCSNCYGAGCPQCTLAPAAIDDLTTWGWVG